MPFVTVTKAQFAKLKGHHLDVLLLPVWQSVGLPGRTC